LPRLIATANKYEHAGSTFLEGHILAHLIGDRVYAEINPHRSENGGTRSFRFSYSNPPLQQMPSRDEELGPLIRRVFLPEDDEFWAESDASQQEFRFVVRHASQHKLRKAAEAVAGYLSDLIRTSMNSRRRSPASSARPPRASTSPTSTAPASRNWPR
jgi:hypothetical protein